MDALSLSICKGSNILIIVAHYVLQRETYPELGLTYGQLGIDDHTHVPPGIYLLISFIT